MEFSNNSELVRPSTPLIEPHTRNKEHSTPNKAALVAVYRYYVAHGISTCKQDLFQYFNVPPRFDYRAIAQGVSRRRHHQNKPETRGRKTSIDPDTVRQMEEILESGDFENRALSWAQLGQSVGLSGRHAVHPRTIKNILGDLDYHKCIACQKQWVSNQIAEKRIAFADVYYLHGIDFWKKVRFSDEVHFGLGPQKKLRIIRRSGKRYCADCIQTSKKPEEAIDINEKRFHAWAWVGWNFKSDLYFYEIPTNKNGKMSEARYLEILEDMVLPCIQRGDQFYLEEDGDSAHKTKKVVAWKQKHGVQGYINAPKSPELSIIENCWQPVKQYLNTIPHWNTETTYNTIRDG